MKLVFIPLTVFLFHFIIIIIHFSRPGHEDVKHRKDAGMQGLKSKRKDASKKRCKTRIPRSFGTSNRLVNTFFVVVFGVKLDCLFVLNLGT